MLVRRFSPLQILVAVAILLAAVVLWAAFILRFDIQVEFKVDDSEPEGIGEDCGYDTSVALIGSDVTLQTDDGDVIEVKNLKHDDIRGGPLDDSCYALVEFEGVVKKTNYRVSVSLPDGTALEDTEIEEPITSLLPWGPRFVYANYELTASEIGLA